MTKVGSSSMALVASAMARPNASVFIWACARELVRGHLEVSWDEAGSYLGTVGKVDGLCGIKLDGFGVVLNRLVPFLLCKGFVALVLFGERGFDSHRGRVEEV